jgi:hypothetical protein
MTVFMAGDEVELFTSFNGSVSTHSKVIVAGVNRAGFSFFGSGQSGTVDFTPQTEGWFHFRMGLIGSNTNNSEANRETAFLRNSSGQTIFRLWSSTRSENYLAQILNQGLVAAPSFGGDWDVHYRINAVDGFVRVYFNQVLVTQFDGPVQFASGDQSVSRFLMLGFNTNLGGACTVGYSQLLSSDLPTLGSRIHTLPLSNGSVNEWDGVVTDINDTSNTPATVISTGTVNEEVLFVAGDVSGINSGNGITAVIISTASQAVTGSPVTRQRGRLKIGSTTYDMGDAVVLGNGFTRTQHVLATNPETLSEWLLADVNAVEIGLRAEA